MKTTTRTSLVAAALVTGLLVTACSPTATDEPTPAVTATEQATAPAATPTEEATTEASVTADSPSGTIVPKDQVDALRAQGAHVYVPVTGGDPVIVIPGTDLPDAVIADAKAAAGPQGGGTVNAVTKVYDMGEALTDAGVPAFFLYRAMGLDGGIGGYTVHTNEVPGVREYMATISGGKVDGYDTKEAAIAEMQPLMDANPGIPLLDLTE